MKAAEGEGPTDRLGAPRFCRELATTSAHAHYDSITPFVKLGVSAFADSLVKWSFRHGPIPFGRVSLSEELDPGELSRFDASMGIILLNTAALSNGDVMFDTADHAADAIQLQNKILASLRSQSFLLDLHNNERLFSRDGPLGEANRFAIPPFAYDAARSDPLLAKRIACSLESLSIREHKEFSVSLRPVEWLRGVYSKVVALFSRSNADNGAAPEYRRLDPETSRYLTGRLLEDLTGFMGPMNQGVLLRAFGPEVSSYMESACRAYAEKHQLPPYRGSAIDFLLAARLGGGALLERILENNTADGRSLKRFMLESRSEFGRYPAHYNSLITPLENKEAWQTPVRIGVCGVGLNEEPITLAVMLSECARRAGVSEPDFQVHVLSEGGSVLAQLQQDGPYPFPYEAAAVRAGLRNVFPQDSERILATYFEDVNGYLVPREELLGRIYYHPFKIGQDSTSPLLLQGQCEFITVHNVLQYVGKDGDGRDVDGYAVQTSFEALKALVHASGKVSITTSSSVHPEVERRLHVLSDY